MRGAGATVTLPSSLTRQKMRVVTNNPALDCARLTKPDLVHRNIKQEIKGRDLLELQEQQKQKWSEYHFVLIVDAVEVKAITAAVDGQYIDELREEYVGYKNASIKTMIKQLRPWFVITNSEKIAINASFLAPWAFGVSAHGARKDALIISVLMKIGRAQK